MSARHKTSAFQEIIEAVEMFPLDDREILLDILKNRLREQRRLQLLQEVAEAKQDYAEGKVKFGTVDDFLAALDED